MVCSTETLVASCEITVCHNAESDIWHSHFCENLNPKQGFECEYKRKTSKRETHIKMETRG